MLSTAQAMLEPVPFYMYDDPALLVGLMVECMAAKERDAEEGRRWSMPSFDLRYNSSRGTVHEFSASKYFVRMMMTHPWRTWDPKVAEVFIVPTDVEPVYLEEGSQGPCSARQYQVHLWGAIQALFEKPHIRAKQGADHFWMMSQNDPERLIEKHAPELAEEIRALNYLHFMSVGAMELFPLRSLEAHPVRESIFVLNGTRRKRAWRCSMPVPFVQSFPFADSAQESFASFTAWTRRKYLFYHQFSGLYQDDRSRELRTQALKIPGVPRYPQRVWVGDRFVESDSLLQGFRSSRFCFAIAGRKGGATRKFYDAVAHGCIPVVIMDQWRFSFSPFSGHVRHEDYAIFVPEERWLNDLPGVIRELEDMPYHKLAVRYRALRDVAPFLVYDRPDSHALGAVLLWELKGNCGINFPPDIHDERIYPVGVPLQRRLVRPGLNGTAVAQSLLAQSGPRALAFRSDPVFTLQFFG